MQVLSATDSLVLLFVFVLKSLLSLLFTSRYTMEAFLIFYYYYYYYYYLIPQCLLNILLCISRYIIQHVMCPMPYLVLFVFVNKCYASLSLQCTVLLLLCFLIKNNNESIFCFSLKKWKVYRYKQNRPLSFLVKHDTKIVKVKAKKGIPVTI